MHTMTVEPASEPSQYRITLFFGPEQVEGKSSTLACVFNVKKRSWKGGIQVSIEITEDQIASSRAAADFSRWVNDALLGRSMPDRALQTQRAGELFVQAVCWCRLDLLLQSGITQESQCVSADRGLAELVETVRRRTDFITSYVAKELDLISGDAARS